MFTPEEVVRRQLDAYNDRDVDALMATYAEHAVQLAYPDTVIAEGAAAIRARMAVRLAEPVLHARLVRRIVSDKVVVDHEIVSRSADGVPVAVEAIAIYTVEEGRIVRACFINAAPVAQ
jgi:hypothetical protein